MRVDCGSYFITMYKRNRLIGKLKHKRKEEKRKRKIKGTIRKEKKRK